MMEDERARYVNDHSRLFNWVLLYTAIFFALFTVGLLAPEKVMHWLYCAAEFAMVIHFLALRRRNPRAAPAGDVAALLKALCDDEEAGRKQP